MSEYFCGSAENPIIYDSIFDAVEDFKTREAGRILTLRKWFCKKCNKSGFPLYDSISQDKLKEGMYIHGGANHVVWCNTNCCTECCDHKKYKNNEFCRCGKRMNPPSH